MGDEQPLLDDAPKQSSGISKSSKQNDDWMSSLASSVPGVMQRRYIFFGVPLILSCCVYLATRSTALERAAPTLQKAFVVFRHGSRGPVWTYRNDINKDNIDEYFPEGCEKLSKLGKQEAYALGKRLRQRYGDFVGPFYKSEEVKVYSTLVERTLTSGQLVMASFFPPSGYQIWEEDLKWQPVPIYPNYIFNTSVGSRCPRFGLESFRSIVTLTDNLDESDKEVMNHVMKHAGEPNARQFELFARVWDTIYFQDRGNLPLPDWIQDVFPDKMRKAAIEFLKSFIAGSEPQRQILLWNYARALRDFFHSESNKKMEIHSWHDLNNFAMLLMLGVKEDIFPDVTSCIAVELHERRGQKYFETYYYDSYKSKQPRQLEMRCGMSCSFDDLDNIVDHFVVSNYSELCHDVNGTDISQLPKLKAMF